MMRLSCPLRWCVIGAFWVVYGGRDLLGFRINSQKVLVKINVIDRFTWKNLWSCIIQRYLLLKDELQLYLSHERSGNYWLDGIICGSLHMQKSAVKKKDPRECHRYIDLIRTSWNEIWALFLRIILLIASFLASSIPYNKYRKRQHDGRVIIIFLFANNKSHLHIIFFDLSRMISDWLLERNKSRPAGLAIQNLPHRIIKW